MLTVVDQTALPVVSIYIFLAMNIKIDINFELTKGKIDNTLLKFLQNGTLTNNLEPGIAATIRIFQKVNIRTV